MHPGWPSPACILTNRGNSACRALLQALRTYRRLGFRPRRGMTDNGACYRSRAFRRLCRRGRLRHIRTSPDTPCSNGKAERFIQTSLRERAYACGYENSEEGAAHLPGWLNRYNWHRPHASLGYKPPISRVALSTTYWVYTASPPCIARARYLEFSQHSIGLRGRLARRLQQVMEQP